MAVWTAFASAINYFDLANADFCTGNRTDGKNAVSAITGGFNVNTKVKVNFNSTKWPFVIKLKKQRPSNTR